MERICYTKNGFKGFGSDELKEKLAEQVKEQDFFVNFAYTDYGGDFFDKVAIEYFAKYYKENIIIEKTCYNGKNAFLFGEVAQEFWKETENYLLGFDGIEDFYFEKVNAQELEDFEYFIENELKEKYLFESEKVLDYLLTEKAGYYSITPQGLDFCWETLTNELLELGLIFSKESNLLYLFHKAEYKKEIAEYYVTTYENGNIKTLCLDEKTLSIIRQYENELQEV